MFVCLLDNVIVYLCSLCHFFNFTNFGAHHTELVFVVVTVVLCVDILMVVEV